MGVEAGLEKETSSIWRGEKSNLLDLGKTHYPYGVLVITLPAFRNFQVSRSSYIWKVANLAERGVPAPETNNMDRKSVRLSSLTTSS